MGIRQDQEIRKVQKENKARIVREGKERRRLWALRKTPRPIQDVESVQDVTESETHSEPMASGSMLPNDIVELLTAREKQVFISDSEDEETEVKPKKKKNPETQDTVVLKEIPSAQCLQNSLEFLKKRKMQVSRSSSVLNNANQALRFLSNSGLLK
ncbi:hypothetical protein FNV43_RR17140 [Rhamnella rubrinervis]|uniref:Uncharacterized protein n=1 Tax=Rhamnella rubrinervis TaxID=2594499 RepID=A0A8K0GXS8_9ROSA|nr:hypothetical protein FNV43_RR17140 [Rhamnella rubrinervis]